MDISFRKSFIISTVPLSLQGSWSCNAIADTSFYLCRKADSQFNIEPNILFSYEFMISLPDTRSNTLLISSNFMEINGSDMNTQALYYIQDQKNRLFIAFNDLILAKAVLKSLSINTFYNPVAYGSSLTFFAHIRRLVPGCTIRVETDSIDMTISQMHSRNILDTVPVKYSMSEAQDEFYERLLKAVATLTDGIDELYISLSGGIDSGTIAFLLKEAGKRVKAFTIGTEWSNEYQEAAETATCLGIELEKIEISQASLLESIPEVIRYFGFTNTASIEIALVAYCLYKRLHATDSGKKYFVSGYGSDLLNAGIYSPFKNYDQLASEIKMSLSRTQYSNEFSNLAALNMNIYPIHPFWSSSVIEKALEIPAKYKVVNGKDKYFFRDMMSKKLPHNIAWRKKVAAHQGTGLTFFLESTQSQDMSYQHIVNSMHASLFSEPLNNN